MEGFIQELSTILVAAAVLSSLAFFLRQPIIIAYVFSGVLLGPWGFGLIHDVDFIKVISHLGVTLLLFLAGLNLHPQALLRLFKRTTLVTLVNCVFSFLLATAFSSVVGFTAMESMVIGLSMMFSSTILAVKLLPTTELHQRHMGAVCIGVLILQDLLAIAVMAFLRCIGSSQDAILAFSVLTLKLVVFILLLVIVEKSLLNKLMKNVDKLQEIVFVLSLAWCFGIASISNSMGLFYESGAFFAGVVLARHPVSLFISESLKPLRDFFLVLFFFTLGAKLDLVVMKDVVLIAMCLAIFLILLKPLVFKVAFMRSGETNKFSTEIGIRLGQLSEFSLLVALIAVEHHLIGVNASLFIQLVTIITFIASSYWVVFKYPTPIGTTDRLIRD